MLGDAGTVKSWCPDRGERLLTEVANDRVTSGDGVVHFAVPAAQWWDDIGFN